MGTLVHFTIAILLTFIHQAEPSAETPVFVLKGQDVRLDVQTNITLRKDIDLLFWKFNTSVNVAKYPPKVTFERYKGRAEFSEGNFSLLLKNLQEGDSGCYTAVVSGNNDYSAAKYIIEVQARVEPPVLTVNSSTNATCNMTVTCRGQNSSVTSICNNSICSQVGGESRGAETSTVPLLSVYVAGGSIICNHSNQVSWANDTKEIMEFCPMTAGENKNYNYALTFGTPVGAGFVGTAALIGFILWRKQKKRGKEEIISTDYATVMTPDNSQAGGEEQVSPGEGPASLTIYSMVGPQHPQPVNHQLPPVDLPMSTMSTMPPMPESLYAVVGKKTSKQ